MEFEEGISKDFRDEARTIEDRVCYSEFRSSIVRSFRLPIT
jgi:hypothetical protein